MAESNGPPTDDVYDARATHSHDPEDEILSLEAAAVGSEVEPPLLPSREPMHSIFRVLGAVEQVVGSVLLLMVLVLVLTQVVQRYVPGSRPWTGELARYSMVWTTFLLAGYLVAYAPYHIAIHIIDFVVKGRWLVAIKLFVDVVVLLTCLVIIYGSYTLIKTDIGQVSAAGQIPLRYINAVPLVGFFLVALRAVLAIVIRDGPNLLGRRGEAA